MSTTHPITDPAETQMAYDASEAGSYDMLAALYWYCADHHEGQASDLYAILSRSLYHPSSVETSPANGVLAQHSVYTFGVYDCLVEGWVEAADLEAYALARYDLETEGM